MWEVMISSRKKSENKYSWQLDEATSIVFMVNVEEGLTDTDQEIYQLLRKANKPLYVVVNKVDSAKELLPATEFLSTWNRKILYAFFCYGKRNGRVAG